MSTRNPTRTAHALSSPPWIGAVDDEFRMYSDDPSDYTLGPPIGFGASSTVYAATYHCPDTREPIDVALKVVDLDKLPLSALKLLTTETQLMSLSKHPNVLRVRGTWLDGRKLYIALRLMRAGSILDCMRYKFTAGIDEESTRCILKQALEGLNYIHVNGFIHRDVKAANLLIDDDGTVLLGDLGVSASLTDEDAHVQGRLAARQANVTSNRSPHSPSTPTSSSASAPAPPPLLGKRKSFVGTPCWMAPEVISQKQYDSSADIWSLGITALELAQGRAPYSRDPPARVLAKILNNDPPTLDRSGGKHKYSRAFADVVALCLCKDPEARPTAEQLLALPFFRARSANTGQRHLVVTLLTDLPPLADRQERRRQSSIASNPSASSWDFSTTTTAHTHMTGFCRNWADVQHASPSPTPTRTRSRSAIEGGHHAQSGAGRHFRTNSLRVRSASIGGECEGSEEGAHALVLKSRRDRARAQPTRGRDEATIPLLASATFAGHLHPPPLVSEPESRDLDAPPSEDDEADEEEADGRHLGVGMLKSHSVAGSGSGSTAGSSIVDPSPLAPPSSASLSSVSSPEDPATPPTGTTPSSAPSGGGTIKMWRKLHGKVKTKTRHGSTSSAGTGRLSGFFGAVLERKMSRK